MFNRLRLVDSSVRLFVYVFGFVRVCFDGRGYLGDEVFVEEIAVLSKKECQGSAGIEHTGWGAYI